MAEAGKKPFAGKKAAPFKKGGGRSTTSKNTAKGTPRTPEPRKGT
jgi:hypothetical protein